MKAVLASNYPTPSKTPSAIVVIIGAHELATMLKTLINAVNLNKLLISKSLVCFNLASYTSS